MRRAVLLALLLSACGPKREFGVELVDAGAPAAATGVVELKAGEEHLRFKSYNAVFHGTTGIRFTKEAGVPPVAAEAAARELRAMAPIFARGRAIPLPFEPPTDGWTARAWTFRGRDYLILANITRDRQWKVPAAALEPTWRPLFELRRDPRELLKEYKGSHYLRPYQVLVLESRLRPKRFLGR